MSTQVETFEFQAEARQLLHLVIHSIYSNKDVFLRELISNSSDALDKLRLEAFRDKDLDVDTGDPHIAIEIDQEPRTLTVRDNGIGMSRDEVIALIGTIAKSGTAEFLSQLRTAPNAADRAGTDLIGQFGVGFYSSFMVADKVVLTTRRAGEPAGTRWESDGVGTYTLQEVTDAPQGTTVVLYLKPADPDNHLDDYASRWKVREIVKRYSDFITWPIRMAAEPRTEPRSEADTEAEDEQEPAVVVETVNSRKALWARSRDEVSDEEYHEFYRHISHDWNDPIEIIRMQAEGTFEYQALLFLPSRAPLDLYMRERRGGIQLYVKRVFIMDDCPELMPEYLRFVKGVVDAADLSLNVSREILQQDRQIQLMRKRLVKRVLTTVKTMMTDNPEKYTTFWQEFGRAMKEGLLTDHENQEQLLQISSFNSTHDPDKPTTLQNYVERMKESQQHIYYLCGESRAKIENSPHMEAFQAQGYEVLVLTDPIDEMWVDSVPAYDGKQFQSVAKGQADLTPEQDDATDQLTADFADLLAWLTTILADNVKEVRLSTRLTTSPSCLVGDTHDPTPNLEKMYRAWGQQLPPIKRILELNPTHPLVTGLRTAHANRPDDPALTELAELIHGMALLAEGGELDDPSRFIRLLANRLEHTLE